MERRVSSRPILSVDIGFGSCGAVQLFYRTSTHHAACLRLHTTPVWFTRLCVNITRHTINTAVFWYVLNLQNTHTNITICTNVIFQELLFALICKHWLATDTKVESITHKFWGPHGNSLLFVFALFHVSLQNFRPPGNSGVPYRHE